MRIVFMLIIAFLSFSGVLMLHDLANAWLTVGHGLNPWLAYPMAVLLLALVPVMYHLVSPDMDAYPPLDL